ncbi:MAG TPA: trehalose-6-phosphate synthase [Acidimicrobiales bacterium]
MVADVEATDRKAQPPLVIVSNRGPVSFARGSDGSVSARRGGGGFAATTATLVADREVTWVAASMTGADREMAAAGDYIDGAMRLRLIDLDPDLQQHFYGTVSNETLWFIHHGMFDLVREPGFDRQWRRAWDDYIGANEQFAAAVSELAPSGASVLVQDYHLSLVGGLLRDRRPDLRTVHFHHTPFCGPNSIRILPADVATTLLSGLAASSACGFHSQRWANAFAACCEWVLGPDSAPPTFVAPLGPDPDDICRVAASAACAEAGRALDDVIGDCLVVARTDRIEPSKNVVRGFQAFDELLESYPQWRERAVFVASMYPSRSGLKAYERYRAEVDAAIDEINGRWATAEWSPIVALIGDDFPRSVALLRRYDVLLVNPIKDGLNLVASEGPLVNDRHGVLALSRDAGAFDLFDGAALEVHPYDIAGTADLLHAALSMPDGQRRDHAAEVARRARLRSPSAWLADQLSAENR